MSTNLIELDKPEARHPDSNDWVWSTFQEGEAQLQRDAAAEFLRRHGSQGDKTFYACPENGKLLQDWIDERGVLVSLKNLECAQRDLQERGLLKQRPEPDPEPPAPVDRIKHVGEVTFVRDAISTEDRERYADKPYESDVARKRRDEQLRHDAIAERYSRRPENHHVISSGEARAIALKLHPEFAINSPEYNAAVARLVRGEELA